MENNVFQRRPLAKIKQEIYLLAKDMVDNGDRANGDLLFEGYLYLCDYINFVDKIENDINKQKNVM